MEPKQNVIKVSSVSEARRKNLEENNKYIKKYGELLWTAALLTAYQNGGYKELQYNYEHVPMRSMQILLDAYNYKRTELEFTIAQGASRPHMKKADGQKYMDGLVSRLEGRD